MNSASEQPRLRNAVFGVAELDLPGAGIDGVAVWPVIGTASGRLTSPLIGWCRRQRAWIAMRRVATQVDELELVDPPGWARRAIARRRARAGLDEARTR